MRTVRPDPRVVESGPDNVVGRVSRGTKVRVGDGSRVGVVSSVSLGKLWILSSTVRKRL